MMTAEAAASFHPFRPLLARLAYRMLGSVSDAEDVIQEAFIRWMRVDHVEVREPEAFLRRIVTRLCLDQLRSARQRRETYIGPWLPDPVVEDSEPDDVTLPLLMALERLSPLERAAFLLHDVFGLPFEEIAEAVDRDPAACRQLASRARVHVREARPRFAIEQRRGLVIAEAFFTASRSGDVATFGAMLAADVSFHADGGGKRPALFRPLHGREVVLQVFGALARRYSTNGSTLIRTAFVNGLPGFVTREADGVLQTTALAIEDERIVGIYVVRNPDKLAHLQ